MEWRHAILATAVLLAVAGIVVFADAAADLTEARAEQAACLARAEGVWMGSLSCMDFSGIDAPLQIALGVALLLGALVLGGVAAWLARGGRALRSADPWWLASVATGTLAGGLGWAMGGSGVVTAFLAAIVLALALTALASGAIALQVSSRRGS